MGYGYNLIGYIEISLDTKVRLEDEAEWQRVKLPKYKDNDYEAIYGLTTNQGPAWCWKEKESENWMLGVDLLYFKESVGMQMDEIIKAMQVAIYELSKIACQTINPGRVFFKYSSEGGFFVEDNQGYVDED